MEKVDVVLDGSNENGVKILDKFIEDIEKKEEDKAADKRTA